MFKKDVNNSLTSWKSRNLTLHFQRSHLPVQIADMKWESQCKEGKCGSAFYNLGPLLLRQVTEMISVLLTWENTKPVKANKNVKTSTSRQKAKKRRLSYDLSDAHVDFSHGKSGSSWPDKLHSQRPFLSLGKRFCTSLQWLWLIQAVVVARPSENNSKKCLHSSPMFPLLLSHNILHV